MTTWRPDRLAVAYDDGLLDWQLGDGHPTNPIRAKLAVAALQERGLPLVVEPITCELTDELEAVHAPTYVCEVLDDGRSNEWTGSRPELGAVAAHMFAGTVQLARAVSAGQVEVGFSPQGAKHHAMADRSSGFCVFNDMAWAAQYFAGLGERVLYVDVDAHHGDGVEALTRDNPLVMTCSVHDSTIFPGTGHAHEPTHNVLQLFSRAGGG